MALNVPSEPKIYTTKYSNFKGVDMTNDPSNVWYRRSPDGLNMLPDLDGRPYKRKGWDIGVPVLAFQQAYGSTVEITPVRTFYFELGGYDYLAVFTSVGLFTVTSTENPSVSNGTTYNGNRIEYHASFIHESPVSGAYFDPNKAFFFEGGGEAAFYVFATANDKQVLTKYTFESPYFTQVEAKIPLVLYLCDENGAGQLYEPINMLTGMRTIGYANDKTTVANNRFYLPGDEVYYSIESVEVRTSTGGWTTAAYSGGVGANYIQFSTLPTHYVDGEDNIRVTYTPVGEDGEIATRAAGGETGYLTITKSTAVWQYTDSISGTPRVRSESSIATIYVPFITLFYTSNYVPGSSTFQISDDEGATWSTLDPSLYDLSYGAYNTNVTIKAKQALYVAPSVVKITPTTEWELTPNPQDDNHKYRRRATHEWVCKRYIKHNYSQWYRVASSSASPSREAFWDARKSIIFGNGLINQVFIGATDHTAFASRVWYSGATDPSYFPDTNYIEVGATDKAVMGFLKVGQYLGIVKGGTASDETIYLAYPTSFENETTYAVKQSIGGIGAVSKGAFNILNTEPLFLSSEGVMGIDETGNDERRLRNRSYFINKALCSEADLSSAISFVYDGMYWLCLPNGHCYVLDGAQKNSWANEKTNMQYEAYYLENIPAQCFAKYHGELWFADFKGNLCRFKTEDDIGNYPGTTLYSDTYDMNYALYTSFYPTDIVDGKYRIDRIHLQTVDYLHTPEVGDTVRILPDETTFFTIVSLDEEYAFMEQGARIKARWATIADDDNSVNYFKSLRKKGCLVSLLPSSDSGVTVYLRKDEKDPILIGTTDADGHWLPYEAYIKKKVKKYKRLQIICENNRVGESFGIDEIIKMYTIGNFSKNKR